MDKASAADADRGSGSAAPADLQAAHCNVGDVWPGRDGEHKAGHNEEPEIVNAKQLLPQLFELHPATISVRSPEPTFHIAAARRESSTSVHVTT